MKEQVLDAVYGAIDARNKQRPDDPAVKKSPDTALFGSSSQIDSLGLVNLIVATEEKIPRMSGVAITLADDRALSRDPSPFSTVQTLVDYIELLLHEHGRE